MQPRGRWCCWRHLRASGADGPGGARLQRRGDCAQGSPTVEIQPAIHLSLPRDVLSRRPLIDDGQRRVLLFFMDMVFSYLNSPLVIVFHRFTLSAICHEGTRVGLKKKH